MLGSDELIDIFGVRGGLIAAGLLVLVSLFLATRPFKKKKK
jgi:hypothetical protein